MKVGSSSSFKTINLTVHVKKIRLPDKFNLHMMTRKLFVNDSTKSSAAAQKAEHMLGKVIKQLKLEKANSRALSTQTEELKKIVVKIGVNPNDNFVVHKLLQSVESDINVLKKRLKLPIGEHSMAAEVAEVENEK